MYKLLLYLHLTLSIVIVVRSTHCVSNEVLYDLQGRVIEDKSKLENGIYIEKTITDKDVIIKKIVINNAM